MESDVLKAAELIFGNQATELKLKGEHKILLGALSDRLSGKMSQEELQDLCYKWSVEYTLDEYIIEHIPSEPDRVTEWKNMNSKVKKGLDDNIKKFYQDACEGYSYLCHAVKHRNSERIRALEEMERHFEKTEDREYKDKVTRKLLELRG